MVEAMMNRIRVKLNYADGEEQISTQVSTVVGVGLGKMSSLVNKKGIKNKRGKLKFE